MVVQAVDDFVRGGGVDFESNGVAFAAVVQLFANAFEDAARLLFLHVEIAVAGDAKGCFAEHFVSAIHLVDLGLDELVEEDERGFGFARADGQADKARQASGDGDDAEDGGWPGSHGAAPLVAEEQGEAKGLVEDTGKGMGGIDGDRGKKGVDFVLVELFGVSAGGF